MIGATLRRREFISVLEKVVENASFAHARAQILKVNVEVAIQTIGALFTVRRLSAADMTAAFLGGGTTQPYIHMYKLVK